LSQNPRGSQVEDNPAVNKVDDDDDYDYGNIGTVEMVS
jgi:hypothetical protein